MSIEKIELPDEILLMQSRLIADWLEANKLERNNEFAMKWIEKYSQNYREIITAHPEFGDEEIKNILYKPLEWEREAA